VPITGPADVDAMAAASVIYDKAELARHNRAPISRAVCQHLMQWKLAVTS
jgi:hypothetical protein